MSRLGQIVPENVEPAEINMAPLIDMVFLLLIFFMVTSVFVQETGVEVQRPRAASARDLQRHRILIAVTDQGRILYGGREIGINGVRGLVARLLQSGDLPVIVVADETSQTGAVVSVIDECKLAGAKTVSLAARREQ